MLFCGIECLISIIKKIFFDANGFVSNCIAAANHHCWCRICKRPIVGSLHCCPHSVKKKERLFSKLFKNNSYSVMTLGGYNPLVRILKSFKKNWFPFLQKNADDYYIKQVQIILDSVIQNLLNNPERKFTYVEQAYFQRWWSQISPQQKQQVLQLGTSNSLKHKKSLQTSIHLLKKCKTINSNSTSGAWRWMTRQWPLTMKK